MTVRDYLTKKLADIAEKEARNGLTSGLIVQRCETAKKLATMTESELEKEYVPEKKQESTTRSINGFGYDHE